MARSRLIVIRGAIMLAVLNPGETITAVMSGAAATTNPTYSSLWHDSNGAPDQEIGSLNGVTAATVVSASSPSSRLVDSVAIYNIDTAAVTVTIAQVIGGTSTNLCRVVMPINSALIFDGSGVKVVDTDGQQLTTVDAITGTAGTSPVSTSVATDAAGVVQHTILTLTDLSITVGNTTNISFGSVKVYDFPAGRILILGAQFDSITVGLGDVGNSTPIEGTDGGDIAFGTTATADSTLGGTDVDIVPSTGADPISGGFTGAALAVQAQFDGTTTPIDMYLNMLIDDDDVANGASDVLLMSGVVEFFWVMLGDY